MAQRIQLRRDTAANWSLSNPVLAEGEVGIEIDTGRKKIGDGSTAWNSLPYEKADPFPHSHEKSDLPSTAAYTDEDEQITSNIWTFRRVRLVNDQSPVPSPQNGDIWYNHDHERFEARLNGVSLPLVGAGVIQCYSTLNTNLNVVIPVAINWDNEDFIDKDLFLHSGSRVRILKSGIYKVTYSFCADNTNSARKTLAARLRKNGATEIERSYSYSYSRNTTDDKQTNFASILMSLDEGDYLEVIVSREGSYGTCRLLPNRNYFLIELVRFV